MNKKLLALLAVPALGLSILGINAASAQGLGIGGGPGILSASLNPDDFATRQNTMFQSQATLLGVSVDEVKNAWASGKSFQQLAQDKGISQTDLEKKLSDARTAQITTELKTLVDKGVITQAQADQRLTFLKNQTTTNPKSKKMGRGMRRMGMNLGF